MWKYVSRRIRDTLERSANYFDKRSTTGLTNAPNNVNENKEKKSASPCCWFRPGSCWNSAQGANNTNNNKWNNNNLNGRWLDAITWSSALVLGWYAGQIIHLKHKYRRRTSGENQCVKDNVFHYLKPYVQYISKKKPLFLKPGPQVHEAISSFTPQVHFISNDHIKDGKKRQSCETSSSNKSDSSDDDLGHVLNSIENRLGLAAIESGHFKDGLNLLRSAANRNHAPALYNLALCYEMGLGVHADEKMAMELYRSAASLEHPNALYNLGIYYGQGRGGLTRDYQMAARLLRLAAVKGNEDAVTALKSLDITSDPVYESDTSHLKPNLYLTNEDIVPTYSAMFAEQIHPDSCHSLVF